MEGEIKTNFKRHLGGTGGRSHVKLEKSILTGTRPGIQNKKGAGHKVCAGYRRFVQARRGKIWTSSSGQRRGKRLGTSEKLKRGEKTRANQEERVLIERKMDFLEIEPRESLCKDTGEKKPQGMVLGKLPEGVTEKDFKRDGWPILGAAESAWFPGRERGTV